MRCLGSSQSARIRSDGDEEHLESGTSLVHNSGNDWNAIDPFIDMIIFSFIVFIDIMIICGGFRWRPVDQGDSRQL